jgi:hypothetical protein
MIRHVVLAAALALAPAALLTAPAPAEAGAIRNNLTVVNNTKYTISFYLNHEYLGTVEPFSEKQVYVGQDADENAVLTARSGSHSWGPFTVSGSPRNFTWTLTYSDR